MADRFLLLLLVGAAVLDHVTELVLALVDPVGAEAEVKVSQVILCELEYFIR